MEIVYLLLMLFGVVGMAGVAVAFVAVVWGLVYVCNALRPSERRWWWRGPRSVPPGHPLEPDARQLANLRASAIVLALPGLLGGIGLSVFLVGVPLIVCSVLVIRDARALRPYRTFLPVRASWLSFGYAAFVSAAWVGWATWFSLQGPHDPEWSAVAIAASVWALASLVVGWQLYIANVVRPSEASAGEFASLGAGAP